MIEGLPERLKESRTRLHLSQRGVAEYLKISPSIVSAYETGERTPSTENLLKLSSLFRCSTDYLLGRVEDKPGAVLDVSGLTDDQVRALVGIIEVFRK